MRLVDVDELLEWVREDSDEMQDDEWCAGFAEAFQCTARHIEDMDIIDMEDAVAWYSTRIENDNECTARDILDDLTAFAAGKGGAYKYCLVEDIHRKGRLAEDDPPYEAQAAIVQNISSLLGIDMPDKFTVSAYSQFEREHMGAYMQSLLANNSTKLK